MWRPVAPHDGSASATFSYDEASATLTLTGKGAHLGLPKAVNEKNYLRRAQRLIQ